MMHPYRGTYLVDVSVARQAPWWRVAWALLARDLRARVFQHRLRLALRAERARRVGAHAARVRVWTNGGKRGPVPVPLPDPVFRAVWT